MSDKSEYQYKIKETLCSNGSIKRDGQNCRLSRNRKLNSIRNFHPFMKRKSVCYGKTQYLNSTIDYVISVLYLKTRASPVALLLVFYKVTLLRLLVGKIML